MQITGYILSIIGVLSLIGWIINLRRPVPLGYEDIAVVVIDVCLIVGGIYLIKKAKKK